MLSTASAETPLMSSSMKKMRSQPSIRASMSPALRFMLRSLLRARHTLLPGPSWTHLVVSKPASIRSSRSCGISTTAEPASLCCVSMARTSSACAWKLHKTMSLAPVSFASLTAVCRFTAGRAAGTMIASRPVRTDGADGQLESTSSACVGYWRTLSPPGSGMLRP